MDFQPSRDFLSFNRIRNIDVLLQDRMELNVKTKRNVKFTTRVYSEDQDSQGIYTAV